MRKGKESLWVLGVNFLVLTAAAVFPFTALSQSLEGDECVAPITVTLAFDCHYGQGIVPTFYAQAIRTGPPRAAAGDYSVTYAPVAVGWSVLQITVEGTVTCNATGVKRVRVVALPMSFQSGESPVATGAVFGPSQAADQGQSNYRVGQFILSPGERVTAELSHFVSSAACSISAS